MAVRTIKFDLLLSLWFRVDPRHPNWTAFRLKMGAESFLFVCAFEIDVILLLVSLLCLFSFRQPSLYRSGKGRKLICSNRLCFVRRNAMENFMLAVDDKNQSFSSFMPLLLRSKVLWVRFSFSCSNHEFSLLFAFLKKQEGFEALQGCWRVFFLYFVLFVVLRTFLSPCVKS